MSSLRKRALEALEWIQVQEALANRTRSPIGHALATAHEPFHTPAESQRLRQRIAEAQILRTQSPIQGYLSGTQNPVEFLDRASREGVLTPAELFACGHFMETLGLVGEEMRAREPQTPNWAADFKLAPKTPSVCARIQRSVNSDGAILDTASSELARLRRERSTKRAEFEGSLDARVKDWYAKGYLQDKFYDVQDGRYVVPVKVDQQSKMDGALYSRSNTGQSVFIEPAELTVENNALKQIDLSIRAEEYRILRTLSQEVGALASQYFDWPEVLAELDLAFAAAQLNEEWELKAPITSRDSLKLKEVFHPGLKAQNVSIVKNSFNLSPETRGLLISGPNTGGKTVLIKAAALAASMARAGLFVPALEGTEIPHYADVYAFIGDEQNIAAGLSSFSAQIMDMRNVLSDQRSPLLIIIDEMLSSTDPEEASALAQALIEDFVAKGHHVVVTSHFSELSLRCKTLPHISVAAMEFNEGRPTYKLRPDELGSSHALEVAERLGVPQKILKRARELVSTAKLDYERAQAELKRKELSLEEEVRSLRNQLLLEKERYQREMREKLSEFMKAAQSKVEETLNSVAQRSKALEKLKGLTKNTLRDVEHDAQKLDAEIREEELPIIEPESLMVGSAVKVRSMGKARASVLEVRETTALLQVGNFRLERPIEDLELIPGSNQPTRHSQSYRISTDLVENVPSKLDLRGRRYDEALAEAERYIDQAFRSGKAQVTVITGHGTGALKKGLKELISTLPYIREAKPERGNDDGATLIEFER